ncbi:MAG: hypothetical protein ACTSXD_11955 [Candidatus Heimdallarchaeaceae archaeon]
MNKKDLERILVASLDLPSMNKIRSKIAEVLPNKFPKLNEEEIWELSGILLTNYCSEHFRRIGDVYDYISNRRYQLAEDVVTDLDR